MAQVALVVKNPPTNVGDVRDMSLVPGSERSPRGGHGNPLQYFCLKNPTDRGGGKFGLLSNQGISGSISLEA